MKWEVQGINDSWSKQRWMISARLDKEGSCRIVDKLAGWRERQTLKHARSLWDSFDWSTSKIVFCSTIVSACIEWLWILKRCTRVMHSTQADEHTLNASSSSSGMLQALPLHNITSRGCKASILLKYCFPPGVCGFFISQAIEDEKRKWLELMMTLMMLTLSQCLSKNGDDTKRMVTWHDERWELVTCLCLIQTNKRCQKIKGKANDVRGTKQHKFAQM